MKKTIFSLAILLLSVCGPALATGINFVENKSWKEILATAKKEKKLIFLDAYATWCGPCKYLQQKVFVEDEVGTYFNKTFINAKIDMEEGEGPALSEQFTVTAYPTLLFVNGDGQVVHKYVGALDPENLLSLGKEAVDPTKQYYTVKAKAKAGTLAPAAFHPWVHSAEGLKDEDLEDILSSYLASEKYPFMEKEMLQIFLDHNTNPTEKLLTKVATQKQQVMKILDIDQETLEQNITKKAATFALESSMNEETIDFAKYKQQVARFSPTKADLETQKIKVKYYFYTKENSQALDALAQLLSNTTFQLPASEMASIITENAENIVAANRGPEFLTKIGQFKLLPKEQEKTYLKDFAQLSVYHFQEDKAKVKALAQKINQNPNTPEDLKDFVQQFNED